VNVAGQQALVMLFFSSKIVPDTKYSKFN
jgi:hypothetical protein